MGEDIKNDLEFDALKAEIGKLGAIDCEMVEKTAVALLKSKSKDLRVLAFLSYVLLKTDKWESFADIFDGLAQLAEKNYDGLWPERPRGKELAIKWLSEERYKDLVNQKQPAEKDYDHIARMTAALTKLKTILEPKFPEGSPFPSELFKKSQQWESATKPKPKPAAPPPGAPGMPAVSAADAPIDSPKTAQTLARKAARFLIEKEPSRVMGYRLMRSVRWDLLEKAPPAEGGKTQLAGPAEQQRTYFAGLVGQKDWKTLFDKAEESFASGANHLWLSLPRFQAMACKELGDAWKEVRRAILIETRFFLDRLPDILQCAFADGTPFADDATKQWINEEVKAGDAGSAAGSAASAPADPLVKEEREVNALVAANQVEKALELLQTAMRTSASEAHNFNRSILVGKLLLKAKQPDLALSILETLDEKIVLFHLDKWDPDLAIDAWSVLIQTLKVAKAAKPAPVQAAMSDKQAAVLKKISQISPQKAFELNK